jgi:hypothetical protein
MAYLEYSQEYDLLLATQQTKDTRPQRGEMSMAWRNEEEDCSAMNNLLSIFDSQGTPPSEAKEARAIYYIVVPTFSNSQVSEVSLAEWLSHSIYANKSLGVAQVSLLSKVTSSTSPGSKQEEVEMARRKKLIHEGLQPCADEK